MQKPEEANPQTKTEYSGADIAKLYGAQPNQVGAWISRAAKKLKKDVFLVENDGANS